MSSEQKYDIFISYRRATGANAARMMQLALTARGYSVFLDYDSLEDGVFNEAIYSAIDSCEVFILMMTEEALDRCTNPGDWVRLEIQRAIERGKRIVPVRPNDQDWSGFPANLPNELQAIRNLQISKLDMEELFNESIGKIETARFPKELRRCRRQTNMDAEAESGEMFRNFVRARSERDEIADLPDYHKLIFANEIRTIEDDLAAAEEAKSCSAYVDAGALVSRALSHMAELYYTIGVSFSEGLLGEKKDEEEAVRWFLKAAELENDNAQFELAHCYQRGKGVEKDEEEAVRWYRRAAEQGRVDAQFSMGVFYEKGIGVLKNVQEAVRWYRKAAEQGDASSQSYLGFCYLNGHGVVADAAEAVCWFRKAAEQGYDEAQFGLGICYLNGQGVVADATEAARLFHAAAVQGLMTAQYNLGACYANGDGVEQDEAKAVSWFRKAAEQGDKGARDSLRKLGF